MAIEGITSYYHENRPLLSVASEKECERIIEGSLEVLEKTGMVIQSPRALNLLVENGCSAEGDKVKIPSSLVKEAISSAAKEMVLYTRNGEEAMRVGGLSNYYGPGPTNPFVNDFHTGEVRSPQKSDIGNTATVVDACEHIDYVMGLANVMDYDVCVADVAETHEVLQNTTKPSVLWAVDPTGMQDTFDMCAAVAGGWEKFLEKPFMCMFPGCPQTPLILNADIYNKFEYAIKKGVPCLVMTGPQLGAVAPVTMAGSTIIGLAEMFTMLVLSQLLRKGSVLVMGIVVVTMDMKSTRSAYGTPEHCLCDSLQSDIFHYLNLPHVGTGGVTEAKIVDEQSAIESSMQILTDTLSGSNMVHDVGFLDGAMSGSLDQIVMCDEIIAYAKRFTKGINFDDEHLALEAIHEVGPGGEFLTEEHTFDNYRDELWVPSLHDREQYATWLTEGKKDMRTRIHEKTAHILTHHSCEPLSKEVIGKLDEIWERAQKRVNA